MRLYCLTDESYQEIIPSSSYCVNTPFYAHKTLETLKTLISCFTAKISIFPINPRLPQVPLMPEPAADCATFLYTSGTSAFPKIAMLSFDNYYYSAEGSNQACQLDHKHRWLLSLPLFHVGGIAILFRCIQRKATVVISAMPLLDAILHHKITHLSLVPTQLYRLLQEDKKKIYACSKQLKVILLGGAPIPESLYQQALLHELPVFKTYGLTEMCSQVYMEPFPGILPHREVMIAEDGEILVRGKTLFLGYAECARQEGWFATKDLGFFTKEGHLQIIGRKDNQFISGGENIQPEEIERALLDLPGITEAVVVPISDEEFGMRPFAFITTENSRNNFNSIQQQLKERLPSFKIPQKFALLPDQESFKRSRLALTQLAKKTIS